MSSVSKSSFSSSLKFRLWVCSLITVIGIYLLIPTVWSLWNPEAEKMPTWMVDTAMRLGLDLKGGVHLVLGVDLDKVSSDQLHFHGVSLEKGLKKEGMAITSVTTNAQKGELEIKMGPGADSKKFSEYVAKNYGDTLELLSPVAGVEYLRLSRAADERVRERAREQSIQTIRNRIDEFGVAEPLISKKGEDQILVQFPGAKEPERLKSLIGQTAKLNFHIVSGCTQDQRDCITAQRDDLQSKIVAAEKAGNYTKDTYKRFSEYRDRINSDLKAQLPAETFVAFEKATDPNEVTKIQYIPVLLSSKDVFSGEFIDEAFVNMSNSNGMSGADRPEVAFHINSGAAKNFEQFTGQFVSHFMAIVLDGVVKSKPVLQSAIGDSGRVTLGNGSIDDLMKEAQDLAIVLRAGALPATIEVQEERVIGPSMGRDAIESGKLALMWGFLLAVVFMIAYYGAVGFLAGLVTTVNVALIFAVLGSLHATLTLPGIAGIVLTISMAVDALIIIFERMREETRNGRGINQVIEMGFDKAFSAILDSNLTTIIGAFVLLNFGTGSIRGFAFTLMVGIVTNIFMATYFAKTLFLFFMKNKTSMSLGLSQKELKSLGAKA